MELFWIIFITFAAAGFAFFVGGYVDRKAERRQQEYERGRREQWLSQVAEFSRGFAELMSERSLIARDAAPTVCHTLCVYIMEHSDESPRNS